MGSWLPIRWRLTLWYVAIVALALGLFAGGLYVGLRHELYAALDDTLRSRAALTLSVIDLQQGVPRFSQAASANPREGEQFVRLVGVDGQLIAEVSPGFDASPSDPAGLAAALAGTTTFTRVWVGGERLRVLSQPVLDHGRVVGALQIGSSESRVSESLATALGLIALVGPLVLLVVSAGGIWAARRALAPVVAVADLASQIEASDLSRRIDLALPDDEVGRLARTVNAMLDRIETAFRRQRQFTADASHELRTPLALLQSQLEVALASPRDPLEDEQVFTALAHDVARLSRLSSALLTLARGDAGAITLSRDQVDLADLLSLIAEQYATLATEAGVRLVVDAEAAVLRADEDRLIQLLLNLVDNALRSTPPGGQLTLGCRRGADAVCLWVSDTGSGIPSEHLPHLFERFYRVDASRGQTGGVGLGLNICQTIVAAHGGTITLTSTVGVGTTVRVRLPHGTPPAAHQA